jgi:hypothetical protein
MTKLRCVFTVLCCCCCLSAGAWAQTVRVNWKDKAPFPDYRTYSWSSGKQQGSGFYRQWVRQYVDAELAKKGMTKVSAKQNPDLLVVYNMSSQEVLDSTTTSDGFGFGDGAWGYAGGWGGWGDGGMGMGSDMTQTEAQPRMMGILTVDLVEAKKHVLVWRGQATEDSISNSQKGDEKQVEKSVQKMFDHFPPKGKK